MDSTKATPSVVLGDGGEIRLPVGFRFRPTDEELLVHYLNRKVLSAPLPARVIPELDVLRTDPWGLPGDLAERMHFFSKRAETGRKPSLRRKSRRAFTIKDGSGYWKPSGKEKRIVASGSNLVIGTRQNLVFCEGQSSGCARSQWMMHELRLRRTLTGSDSTWLGNEIIPPALEKGESEWAVYRLFQRRRKQPKSKKNTGLSSTPPATEIDFRNEVDFTRMGSGTDLLPPPPPSPCLSPSPRDHHEKENPNFYQ